MDKEYERASPPDDAGHEGGKTRPEDTLEMRPTDPRNDADAEAGRHPPLHRDPIDQGQVRRAAMPLSGLGWMIGLIALILVIAYLWTLGRY